MNRSSLPISLSTLKKWWESEDKILKCTLPYQRHAGMWNSITKSNLVWSLLADSYVPPIVLLKDKAGVDSKGKDIYHYEIEDGQQRLTNLFAFMNDEYELHGATSEVELDGTIYDLAGLKYSELSEECQDAIKNYRFSVQCLENYTLEEVEKLYFCINSGVALSNMQKGKAKLGSELVEFLNSLLAGNFFTQAINITESQALKEDDLLMLMQGMALLDQRHENREFKNISAATMLSYAESIRGTYNVDKKEMLHGLVGYLDRVFSSKNKFLRKNNTPIVFVMAKIALEQGIEPEAFRAFINDFANSLYPAYEEASGSGNVKILNVNMRLRVMFLAMCEYFKINPENIQKPFAEDIPLYMESSSENIEVNEDVSSSDEPEEAETENAELDSDSASVDTSADGSEDFSEVDAEEETATDEDTASEEGEAYGEED